MPSRMGRFGALLLLFLLSNCSASARSHATSPMRLELSHRNHQHASEAGSRIRWMRKLVTSDTARTRMIPRKLHKKEGGGRKRGTARMALKSAADFGTGLYLATVELGTPPQKFTLIADTGSDLTWINCDYEGCTNCERRRSSRGRTRDFNATESQSFRTIPCLSGTCRVGLANLFSLSRCPTRSTPCAFDYSYSDGSSAAGIFANETVTLGLDGGNSRTLMRDVVIGCGSSSTGQSFQSVDGVLGMALSEYSFAAVAGRTFGGKFSYCLVDHLSPSNVSSFLTFGQRSHRATPQCSESDGIISMRSTKLLLGVLTPFYAVSVRGISIDDDGMLPIHPGVWDGRGKGGTILDSGTSLTALTTPVYGPVMRALRDRLGEFPPMRIPGVPLEFCFNSTGFEESSAPRFRLHFTDGAFFQPPTKSFIIDAAKGVKCLGFVPAGWPGPCVIGNIMQQNHVWEFDLHRGKLAFSPSRCTAAA